MVYSQIARNSQKPLILLFISTPIPYPDAAITLPASKPGIPATPSKVKKHMKRDEEIRDIKI